MVVSREKPETLIGLKAAKYNWVVVCMCICEHSRIFHVLCFFINTKMCRITLR